MLPRCNLLYLAAFHAARVISAPPGLTGYNTVNLRIESNTTTLYEGPIISGPRNITLGQGEYYGDVACNGQNGLAPGANPGSPPGNTPTDALDAASKLLGFKYDGYYADILNDFDITSIGGVANYGDGTIYTYWGILTNYQVSQFGFGEYLSGCQQLLNPGDEVLWAYQYVDPSFNADQNPTRSYLKLSPTTVTVKRGSSYAVTVIDGRSGNPIQNATVAGVTTDANGKATILASKTGFFQYKATRTYDVRSNVMNVVVT